MPTLSKKPVTGSAFTQARYKVKPELFSDLVVLLEETYQSWSRRLWKGHAVLAGDGSTLNLPPSEDIEGYFGVYAQTDLGVKRHLARVLFIYDVLNGFIVDSQISTVQDGEKTLLRKGLSKIGKGDVLVLDRGFGNFCTIKELMELQLQFCIRLSVSNSNFAKRVMEQDDDDFIVKWAPSKKEKENCKVNSLEYSPVQLRCTKIKLISGETELLITSLCDQKKYASEDLKELYSLRWGVEEGFKNLKPKMKIEQFGCKKVAGIFQEFYAHIFCMNLVALIGSVSSYIVEAKTSKRKWQYKYNWKNAYRYVRGKIIGFLFNKHVSKMLEHLIEQIASSTIPIKADRHFTRDMKASNKKGRITPYNK